MPGKRAEPIGRVDLPVCFGTPANFRKETLTFEVVRFYGTYHAILGRPCYAWFMVVPNYAYECDMECVEHGKAILESATLAANLDGLAKEVPDPKCHAGNFEPAEDIKLVPLDPIDLNRKALSVSATLDPK
jgi:hypothetical protein